MAALDISSLRPAGASAPQETPSAPAKLDVSKLRPASEASAVPAEPKEDILGQVGAGVVTGIPNMVAGFADMMEKGTVQGAIDVWEYPGKMVDALQGKTPKATVYKPVTGDLLRKGLSAAKINPNDYFEAPDTPGERMARMAGEGAVTSIIPTPAGKEKLIETGWNVLKNIFAGGVGGASAQGAMELAPDEWDSVAGLAGGLAGGMGGYGVATLPEAALKGAAKGVDYLRPAVATKANVERLAGERLAGAATDPDAAIAALGNADEIVPGSKPTAFQASGDVGLGTLERAMSRGDEKFKAALLDRVDQQNAARVAALEGIEESGDVGAAVQFFRDRMRSLEEHADTLYDRAEKAAKGEYEGLGDRSAGDVGEAAREAIAARFKQMNGEASALWNSIDPDGTMNVATEPLITEAAKIYGRMGPEEKLSLTPEERNIAGIIGSYGETLPFENFKELRSEITRAMRKAKSFADPNDKAHRRLTMLRGAIEQSVEDSVAGRFAADASLADLFVKQAKEWYADRTRPEPQAEPVAAAATGTDPVARAVPSAEQGAPAAAVAPRNAGAQGFEPRPAESSPRLPEDAGAQRAVEGRADTLNQDFAPSAMNGRLPDSESLATPPAPPVQSPAFKRWFGKSKVVDSEGNPLVVYHGTDQNFEVFDANADGIEGVFFSSSPSIASGYADPFWRESGESQSVIPAYLSLQKPMVIDWQKTVSKNGGDGAAFDAELLNDIVSMAQDRGHDGLIVRGIKDGADLGGGELADTYIAFEPTQIKSTANRGTFDPNDPNILNQSKPSPLVGEKFGGFDTEAGLEGLPQTLIPGVSPIDDAARMRSAAAKPLKGGDAAPPRGGLFDDESREFAERQGSLFQSGAAIRDTMADRFAAAGRPPEEAVAAGTVVDAFYTTMAERLGKSVDELIAEHPLPQVQKGGDTGGMQQGKRAKPPEEKNLYAVHNIKPGGVLNADKMGGLPMPSLAVARIDKGDFSNFGEISLIGSPRLVDPKGGSGAKTYDADVYSPRYPSVTRDIDEKAFNALNRPVVAGVKELGGESYDGIDLSRLEDRGPAEVLNSTGLQYAYLKEKGVPVAIKKKDDGSPDWYANREAVEAEIRGERRADYEAWAEQKLSPLVKRERIFKGFDYNGNRRYREHTLENVLSDMRARLKEGEGFNYGVGTIRSKHAKQFRSIADMKKSSDRLTGSGQMDKAKDEFGDRFFELVDEMRPYYRFDAKSFGYPDDVAGMFGEMAKKGTRALDEGFEGLPPEVTQKVRTYLSDLANAPTEYFETKINRNVGLNEFEAALVPTGTQPRVVDALKKQGLRVIEFDKSRPNARTEAIRKLNDERPAEDGLLFQGTDGPRGSIQFGDTGSLIKMFDSADASTAVHESAHHFLKMFRSMAEGADVPETIAKDWRATKAWWDNNSAAIAKEAGNGVTANDVRQALRGNPPESRLKAVEIDRAFHEQWARGFEQYLRDGKAPNKALRGIYQQFKDWLVSIYQSAAQLSVKLSPEIRKVFDQMLASDESRAGMPKMMDEGAAKRFSDATAATREIKDTFGAKPVKGMLRRPGPTYPYEMTAEGVANNLFKAGPEGASAIKAAMKAGAPKETIEAAAVASLKHAASKDGTIDPAKLAAWRQKYADALREVPELDRRMGSAAKATEAMVDIASRRKEAVDQVQRSAVGKLLKVEDDADVSAVLGRMLGRDTAVKDMRSLVSEAKGDPNAMAGLRRAVVDHMVSRLKTPKDALRSDTFQRYLGKNAPALSQVLTPEQMGSLRAIAMDMKRASKDVRSPGGGSDTAENTAAMKRAGVTGDNPSIIGQVVRRALASGAVGWLTHALQGPIVGAATGAASFLGGTVLQALRAKGIAKVDDLVREAILDPELMRKLLAKAPKRKDAGSADALRRWLGQNAFNDLIVNIGDEEKEWRGTPQRPRPSDEGKMSPTLGVRG